jgi:uncharacterized protein YbdZ (MbtH family)
VAGYAQFFSANNRHPTTESGTGKGDLAMDPVADAGRFLVLRNDAGQCSRRPGRTPIPADWAVVHRSDDRNSRPSYVAAMGD